MDLRRKIIGNKDEKIKNFFQNRRYEPEEELLESPHDMMITQHSQDVLHFWEAPEYEVYERDRRWYLIAVIALSAIIIYALVTNSPIMAITFILIGIVGYIYIQKEPRILEFAITHEGIMAGNEIYEFDNIHSFWIFYDPPFRKVISLHMRGKLVPYIHIPIHNENPVELRHILMDFILEVKQEPSLVDAAERILRI
jgi:uncharacterized membrane protein